jgi:hypothetical protein
MSEDDQQRGLAAIHDIRRRLEQRVPVDDTDTDDLDAEVLDLIARQKERQHDPEHPSVRLPPQRRDLDG